MKDEVEEKRWKPRFHPSYFILHPLILERETRFELATLALARRCSTTELLPLRRDSILMIQSCLSRRRYGTACGSKRVSRLQARRLRSRPPNYGCGSGFAKTPAMNSFKPASELSCRNL